MLDSQVRGGEFREPESRTPADLIFDREDDPELGRVVLEGVE